MLRCSTLRLLYNFLRESMYIGTRMRRHRASGVRRTFELHTFVAMILYPDVSSHV